MNAARVELWRGGSIESIHEASYAVVDAQGLQVESAGIAEMEIFPRSAVKALQALPLLESGAADAFRLTPAELALVCASHSGENSHVSTAEGILAKLGLDESALECGSHWPSSERAARSLAAEGRSPSSLHNNCSGKHSGFLCLGCWMADKQAGQTLEGSSRRSFLKGYIEAPHPVMSAVAEAVTSICGLTEAQAERARKLAATDGCSIPTLRLPLSALATGFARFVSGEDVSTERSRAAQRLKQAVASHPDMVGGTGRFDTRMAEALGERVFVKVGAEAVYCGGFPELGFGFALKVHDGSVRAAESLTAGLIQRFLALSDADATMLDGWANKELTNWNGRSVGRLKAVFAA